MRLLISTPAWTREVLAFTSKEPNGPGLDKRNYFAANFITVASYELCLE